MKNKKSFRCYRHQKLFLFIALFAGSKTPSPQNSVEAKKFGEGLLACAKLVRTNNELFC